MTRACSTGARARRIVLSARKTTTLEARARALSGLARCACRLVFFFARGRCATPSARRTRRLRPRTSPRPRRCARAWSTGPGSSTSSCRADTTSTWAPPSSARRTPRRTRAPPSPPLLSHRQQRGHGTAPRRHRRLLRQRCVRPPPPLETLARPRFDTSETNRRCVNDDSPDRTRAKLGLTRSNRKLQRRDFFARARESAASATS